MDIRKVAISRPISNLSQNMLLSVMIMYMLRFEQKLPPLIKIMLKRGLNFVKDNLDEIVNFMCDI